MMPSQTLTRPCPRCQRPVTFTLHNDLVLGGKVTEDVIFDRFNVMACSGCGAQTRVESDVRVCNAARTVFIQVVVRDEDVPRALRQLRAEAPGAMMRLVARRRDLVEKVCLMLSGLDDVAFELCRLMVRVNQRDAEGKLELRFDHVEGEQILFVNLSQKPPTLLPWPMEVYRNVVAGFETAKHRFEPEVDERLARRLMAARQAAQPKPPPPATSAPPSASK